jgi:hypothetical protein
MHAQSSGVAEFSSIWISADQALAFGVSYMNDDGSAGFFGFILGAMMAAVVCGLMIFATGNLVNTTTARIDSPAITIAR